MDILPSTFDVIVVGTGITESIISAAVARQGHTVLHIDPRDYYGGKWATLTWNDWASGIFARPPATLKTNEFNTIGLFKKLSGEVENIVWKNDVRDLESLWYSSDAALKAEVKSSNRRFNIDIIPKVLMAREEVIQLLIQSNVSRYLEFTCINKLMSSLPPPEDAVIEPIPLSRSDIFTTKTISLTEKRKLMKFLEFVLKSGEADSPSRNTFADLAQMHKLTNKVTHLIQSAVRTMDDCMQMTEDGPDNFNVKFTENCRLFLQSINRYGNQTPFLWTLYGVSEICQSFCRLSAIYGGTYILKLPLESISEDQEEPDLVKVETEGGVEIKAKYLVLCPEIKFTPAGTERSKSPKCIQGITLIRGVLLVVGPRLKDEAVAEPPPGEQTKKLAIYRFGDMDVIELDESSLATPKNFRMLQVTLPYREGNPSAREVIESRLHSYVIFPPQEGLSGLASLSEEKPRVVHGTYFLVDFYDDIRDQELENPKIFQCNSSSTELKDHVEKAREIFSRMYPDGEFLPKAPEPEDVDMEDREDEEADDEHPQPMEEEQPQPAPYHHQNGVAE